MSKLINVVIVEPHRPAREAVINNDLTCDDIVGPKSNVIKLI